MPKPVEDFLNFEEGDVVTLSDLQTQAEFNESEVDFRIASVRKYHEPNDCFTLTCYLIQGPNEDQEYILMVKQVGEVYDLFVYYKEDEGDLYIAEDGQEECPYISVLFKDGEEDFKERIEVSHENDGTEFTVAWDKQGGSSFGVEYNDTDADVNGIVSIAEYFTEVGYAGNDRLFISWLGDFKAGNVEMWYGCLVEDHEVSILPVAQDE